VASGWVVSFTNGTTTFYYSEEFRNLTTYLTHPFLKRISAIDASIDPLFGKEFRVNDVTFSLFNHQYSMDSNGGPLYIDEQMKNWKGYPVNVWRLKGEDTVADSMLLVFRGFLLDCKSVNRDEVQLLATSRVPLISETPLPRRTLRSAYPNAPVNPNNDVLGSQDTRNKRVVLSRKIPIVYGSFTGSEPWLTTPGTGMAVALATDDMTGTNRPKLVVADHPIYSISDPSGNTSPLWCRQPTIEKSSFTHGLQWFKTSLLTIDVNEEQDDAVFRAVITPGLRAYVRVKPCDWKPGDFEQGLSAEEIQAGKETSYHLYTYSLPGDVNGVYQIREPEDLSNIYDDDETTFAFQRDTFDKNTAPKKLASHFPLIFPSLGNERAIDATNGIGRMVGTGTFSVRTAAYTTGSINSGKVDAYCLAAGADGFNMSADRFIASFAVIGTSTTPSTVTTTFDETTDIQPGSSSNLYIASDYGWRLGDRFFPGSRRIQPWLFLITAFPTQTFIDSNSDGSVVGTPTYILKVYSAYLQLEYEPVNISEYWVKCAGKTFGSWIDAGGRSNSYDEGDLIEDPVYIIEDLLRSHTSFVGQTADIDTASFDAAANSSVQARINFHSDNEMSAANAIQNLSIQSTFVFAVSAFGRARAIALNNTSPTVNKTILFHQVLNGRVSLSQTEEIYNSMEINSRFWQEQGSFADINIFENQDSIDDNGERQYAQSWANIAGPADGVGDASVKTVTDLLITDSNSLLARTHKTIALTLIDTFGIDLEPGDWIELDSNSWDARFLFYGETWAGLKFLVNRVTHEMGGTKIEAIQLYA